MEAGPGARTGGGSTRPAAAAYASGAGSGRTGAVHRDGARGGGVHRTGRSGQAPRSSSSVTTRPPRAQRSSVAASSSSPSPQVASRTATVR